MTAITFEGKAYTIAQPNADRLGIDNLKALVKFAARVVSKVREFREDGRYSLVEKIKTPLLLADGLEFFNAQRLDQIGRELLDLNKAEVGELFVAIGEELDVNLAEAELLFTERILPLVEAAQRIVRAFS